uniref:Uncharacterized protein n=1 Tax=Caenorhabditis tropicalis TaxID=1561998 RepID=A0A1I7UA43_9PELO
MKETSVNRNYEEEKGKNQNETRYLRKKCNQQYLANCKKYQINIYDQMICDQMQHEQYPNRLKIIIDE